MSTVSVSRVFNFSAGPAALPLPVLEQVRDELLALPGAGASILEISHRCAEFDAILEDALQRLAALMNLPDSHQILFLQGGAILQNSMVPQNLLVDSGQTADYLVTGSWGKKSAAEVHRFGKLNVAYNGSASGYQTVPGPADFQLTPGSAYCHITYNETIQGVQFPREPETGDVPLVADRSSDMLSQPLDVSRYGLIYACAQKNLGVAGVTMVVIDKSLLERCNDRLPSYLNYANHAEAGSRYNTPPTFGIYVLGLIARWLQEEIGGLERMQEINESKAARLYQVIDQHSGFYQGHAQPDCRSRMNVVFKTPSQELDARFVSEAQQHSLASLKGHRSVGGIRASIYNAMPVEGVDALAQFMIDFAQKNG